MRSLNKRVIVIVLFLILLVITIILRNPSLLELDAPQSIIKTEGATEITINQTKLTKTQDSWVVASQDNFPADELKVEQLLSDLSLLTKDNLVSSNPANHSQYGVGAEGVTLKVGAETLIIGDTGPSFSTNYFRLAAEDEVYLVDVSFEPTVKDPEWRDLSLSFPPSIDRITIQNNNGEFVFEQKDNNWNITKPQLENAVDTRISDLVARIKSMRAEDATVSGEAGSPSVTITVKGVEGEDTLFIGQKEDNERLAKLDSLPYIYYLAPSEFGVFLELNNSYFTDK